jgi:hypothetical protein
MLRLVRRFWLLFCLIAASFVAQAQSSAVILQEQDFPVADSEAVSTAALQQGFSGARSVSVAQLSDALEERTTTLLILPYGSAYPETAWPAILRYLERGGNLIVLGGKPFSRPSIELF